MYKNLLHFYLMFSIVYFGQGISGLPSLSVFFIFKEKFGLDVQQIAIIGLLTSIAWCIKPLYGVISDVLPINGQHRKPYLIGSYLTILLSYSYLILTPLTLTSYITAAVIASFAYAFADVCVDGTTAEISKKYHIQGQAQSIQWGSLNVASVITGFCGGLVAQYLDYKIAFSILMVVFSIIILTILLSYNEVKHPPKPIDWQPIKRAITKKSLWLAAAFLFLLYFSPSFGTALMFIMTDKLHFSKIFMGTLSSIGSFSAIFGAIAYYFLCRKICFKKLLTVSIVISALTTLAYLWYNSSIIAITYAVVFGFIGMIIHLTILEFVARIVPIKAEAFTFAAVCSVLNLGSNGSDVIGGFLYKIIGFEWLVVVSAITTLMCLAFVPFLKLEE